MNNRKRSRKYIFNVIDDKRSERNRKIIIGTILLFIAVVIIYY